MEALARPVAVQTRGQKLYLKGVEELIMASGEAEAVLL